MKPFSLLIKPASADCNLNCEYCFYLEHCSFYPETKKHRMSIEVLETMIKKYMQTNQPNYAFGWQGGEPTLMGIDFFRKVTEFQQKYGKTGAMVANGVQTNGVLIDDEFAEHFGKYKFLMGVSLDGPENVHDYYRKHYDGRGSHAQVIKGIEALKRHNVEFNILVLVNAHNVTKAKEIYNYYQDQGFNYLQHIPCVEFDQENNPLPFAIKGEEWGNFLCETFDLWYKSDTRKVSIRLFDSILSLLVENIRNICHMGRNCCQYFVVEYNGDIFPCDFFVRKELKVGNIVDGEWEEMQNAEVYKKFGSQKLQWSNTCNKCDVQHFCAGDCLKHRTYGSIARPENLSWLCEGWKLFYRHSIGKFKKLAETIVKERQQAMAMQQQQQQQHRPTPQNVGRNAPCPCGSGKKFKKCCGK